MQRDDHHGLHGSHGCSAWWPIAGIVARGAPVGGETGWARSCRGRGVVMALMGLCPCISLPWQQPRRSFRMIAGKWWPRLAVFVRRDKLLAAQSGNVVAEQGHQGRQGRQGKAGQGPAVSAGWPCRLIEWSLERETKQYSESRVKCVSRGGEGSLCDVRCSAMRCDAMRLCVGWQDLVHGRNPTLWEGSQRKG